MLEARLNVKCDMMAKQAVEVSILSIRPDMGPSKQTLPLDKCCVFVKGEKQTSDPKEAIKQMVGRDTAQFGDVHKMQCVHLRPKVIGLHI